jgi:hypothetical protein
VLVFILFGCKTQPDKKTAIQQFDNTNIQFYPVVQQIDSQIHQVVTTPYYLYEKRTIGNVTDSVAINTLQFKKLASEFLHSDISDNTVKKFYKETVFSDLTTKSITLNYTTNHPDLRVRSIDVLLDEETQLLKRIFINKTYVTGDSTIEFKLGWKANRSFSLNKITTLKTGKQLVEQHLVVWNEKSE